MFALPLYFLRREASTRPLTHAEVIAVVITTEDKTRGTVSVEAQGRRSRANLESNSLTTSDRAQRRAQIFTMITGFSWVNLVK